MAFLQLTPGNDSYVQTRAEWDAGWTEILGLAGDDDITVFGWQVQPGPGNDRIERVPTADGRLQWMSVVYWGSPGGVTVDLMKGTARDGWGGLDVLVNVDQVGGTDTDDTLVGNSRDNFFWPTLGNDTVDGGAGDDGVRLPWLFNPMDGSPGRETRLSDVSIRVSADGRQATVSAQGLGGTSFSYALTDVEYLIHRDHPDGPETRLNFADLITARSMAEDTIAAGPAFRWNPAAPLGTPTSVTYSFVAAAPASGPGAAGFRPFGPAEQQLVRDVLAQTSALAGLSFVEVADSEPGQMRFGVSQQAATKGVTWLPGQPGAGDNAGDVWMDAESMAGIAPGTEGYQALLHEIGHALGLRHPRNTDPGENWAMQLREQDDRAALSVMSQAPALGDVFHQDWGLLDVLALRHLYGSHSVATGDDLYRLTADQAGQMTTLVDEGGNDTLDVSGLAAGVRLSLKPGALSDVGLDAQGRIVLHNLAIADGSMIEHALGTAHDDVLIGNDAANWLGTGGGNDLVDGGPGLDTAVLPGPRAAYAQAVEYGHTVFSALDGRSGFVELIDVERVHFSDRAVALDLDGHAGAVAQIIRALFGKEHLANPTFVGVGLQLMDAGMSYAQLVELALGTPVFEQFAGGRSNTAFVNAVYRNVVGVAPDARALAEYTGLLDAGSQTQASLGLLASQLSLNTGSVELVGLATSGIEFVPMG